MVEERVKITPINAPSIAGSTVFWDSAFMTLCLIELKRAERNFLIKLNNLMQFIIINMLLN